MKYGFEHNPKTGNDGLVPPGMRFFCTGILLAVSGSIYCTSASEAFIGPSPENRQTTPIQEDPAEKRSAQIESLKKEQMTVASTLIKEYPQEEQPLIIMGKLYRRLGYPDKALEFWDQALTLNSLRADVLNYKADVAMEKGQFDRAINTWRQALKLDPFLVDVHSKIGRAYMGKGQYDEAIKAFQRALSETPNNPNVTYLIGQSFLQQQDYGQAQSWFEKALAVDPSHIHAHYGLMQVGQVTNQPKKAKQHADRFQTLKAKEKIKTRQYGFTGSADLAQIKNSLAEMYLDVAFVYQQNGKVDKAESLLKRLLDHVPDHAQGYRRLVGLYVTTQQFATAYDHCLTLTTLDPNNPECFEALSMLSLRLKRYDSAESALTRLLALQPRSIYGCREMAKLLILTRKKPDMSKKLAMMAVELEPSAENWFVVGLAHAVNREKQEALEAFKQASDLAPDSQRYRKVYQDFKQRNQ